MNTFVAESRPRQADDTDTGGALLARIGRGDRDALGALYDLYKRPVYSVARRLLKDSEAAEDVVQDVFVSVWHGAGTYDDRRGSVRAWILSHAHHKSVDALRRRRLRSTTPLDDEIPDRADVVYDVLRSVDAGRVRGAIRGLSALQREVIVTAYYGGYSQQEIATRLGVPLGTVKTRMRDGMIKLRGLLADHAAH
jgi:RNA polymerase sigma-70 factor (ECF subfamily)